MKIFEDSDWTIKKPKDFKECTKMNTPNKKSKEYLYGSKPLIDLKANELRHANFYKFHNLPIKKENIMKHKEDRDFRNAVRERERMSGLILRLTE